MGIELTKEQIEALRKAEHIVFEANCEHEGGVIRSVGKIKLTRYGKGLYENQRACIVDEHSASIYYPPLSSKRGSKLKGRGTVATFTIIDGMHLDCFVRQLRAGDTIYLAFHQDTESVWGIIDNGLYEADGYVIDALQIEITRGKKTWRWLAGVSIANRESGNRMIKEFACASVEAVMQV